MDVRREGAKEETDVEITCKPKEIPSCDDSFIILPRQDAGDAYCNISDDDKVPLKKPPNHFHSETEPSFGSKKYTEIVTEREYQCVTNDIEKHCCTNFYDRKVDLDNSHSVGHICSTNVQIHDKELHPGVSDVNINVYSKEEFNVIREEDDKNCAGSERPHVDKPTSKPTDPDFANSLEECQNETVSCQQNISFSLAHKSEQFVSNAFSVFNTNQGGYHLLNSFESDSFECGDVPIMIPDSQENATSNLGKRNRQISTDSSSSVALEAKENFKSTKKLKKKERKKQQVDEDIDKILAELELDIKLPAIKDKHVEIEKSPVEADSIETFTMVAKSKKKKKKQQCVENEESIGNEVCDTDDIISNLPEPTALKEKRKKKGKTKTSKTSQAEDEESPLCLVHENVLSTTTVTNKTESISPSKVEVDLKKDRKKPGKKQLAAMQAAIKKAKEEEERLIQEEIAKQKKSEEAEKLRIEKLRLEAEKKERKKQKEKDKKERLKAEGKFLTKSQKVARARVVAALSAWREHGIDVPNVGEKVQGHESKVFQKKKPYLKSVSPNGSADQIQCNEPSQFPGENTEIKNLSQRQRHLTDPKVLNDRHFFSADIAKTSFSEICLNRSESICNRPRTKSESDMTGEKDEAARKLSPKSSKQTLCDSPIGEHDIIFRSPVVCVLGHVDTGKTKILDKIRKTNVQNNEAGGITQQIGATMVPFEALKEKCSMVKSFSDFDLKLPGLLIIDTPGHESFRNLRSRGSSLCDISILVVDIMHGLEQQTIESIDHLKRRKTPFVVALNKIDRLYGWKTDSCCDVQDVIMRQDTITLMELDKRCKQVIAEFANQNLNAALFYENTDPRSYVSLVPVSALSGDGMGNLLAVVSQLCQNMMPKQLTYSEEIDVTVLEVKVTAGLGTTIDVILVNGRLRETDTIVLVGHDGPIVTQIRSLLMPQPLRELRVKNPYQEFKVVKGTQGVKVSGKDLDKAIAGLPLFVSHSPDDVPVLKEKAIRLLRNTLNSIKLSERGVYVQASTLGSLEALLDFLKCSEVPYSGVKVGPVVKKDVIKASVMLEHDTQYAVILAFDVKIERDAQDLADHLGIKIFQSDIIYHLFDNFTLYKEELRDKKMSELKKLLVFPCKLSIMPEFVFNIRNPIILGVRVLAGILKIGTPLCVPSKNCVYLGTVTSIEVQHQLVNSAKPGDDVCIKIDPCPDESPKIYGRHFDHTDVLVSKISRQTIDVCKEFYRNDLQKSDWNLMVELKKLLLIT